MSVVLSGYGICGAFEVVALGLSVLGYSLGIHSWRSDRQQGRTASLDICYVLRVMAFVVAFPLGGTGVPIRWGRTAITV